jgi:hypothetical protein
MNQFTPDVETILAQAVEIATPVERQDFIEKARSHAFSSYSD